MIGVTKRDKNKELVNTILGQLNRKMSQLSRKIQESMFDDLGV